jgi:RNA polymerase sigma-70 factor (ECF subfamily)
MRPKTIDSASVLVDVDVEEQIRSLLEGGQLHDAATKALNEYGSELFGFLLSLIRDEQDASDVFSQTCEDLWLGLERFEGRCSMRTWLYSLARHAAARFRRSPHRRPRRHVALSELGELAERVRTETLRCRRTDAKDMLSTIRESLADDDRALLVLRIDRGMGWTDIARVFLPDDSDELLGREAARLRKRFQLVKEEIRSRARKAGLLREEADLKPRAKRDRLLLRLGETGRTRD